MFSFRYFEHYQMVNAFLRFLYTYLLVIPDYYETVKLKQSYSMKFGMYMLLQSCLL